MTLLSSSLTSDPGDDDRARCSECGEIMLRGDADVCPDCAFAMSGEDPGEHEPDYGDDDFAQDFTEDF